LASNCCPFLDPVLELLLLFAVEAFFALMLFPLTFIPPSLLALYGKHCEKWVLDVMCLGELIHFLK